MKSLRRLQAFQRKSSTAFFLQSWKLIPDVTARVTLFEREFLRQYCSRLLPERPAVSRAASGFKNVSHASTSKVGL